MTRLDTFIEQMVSLCEEKLNGQFLGDPTRQVCNLVPCPNLPTNLERSGQVARMLARKFRSCRGGGYG